MSDQGRRSMLIWLVPSGVAVFALSVYLLSLGSKGNQISETLSLPVALAGFLLSVVLERRTSRPEPGQPVQAQRRVRWLPVLITIGLGLGAAGAYWVLGDRATINVTGEMAAPPVGPLFNQGTLTLPVPGSPPKRSKLALTVSLTNPKATGNCVRPARLTLTPLVDDESRPPVTAQSGVEVELSLAGATHEAKILVELSEPDPECSVVVTVDRALLFN